MPIRIIRPLAITVLAWTIVLAPVHAHETWAERAILIQFGEPGAPGLDAYKPGQVRELSAIGIGGAAVPVTALPIGQAAVVVKPSGGTDPAAVFFTLQLGHYVITGDDWKDATAAEAAAAPTLWVGSYTVTSILAWHPGLAEPRARAIELVPLVDPLALAVGAPLPLRAFRDGRPQAGLTIELGEGAKPVVSDAAGNLSVPVRVGHQVILGSLDEVAGGHTVGRMAVLSFTHR